MAEVITNEPIFLDSTGRDILAEMKTQSGYLSMIAAGQRSQIYSDMSQIASIIRGGDVEHNAKQFPVGDFITMPWKDLDDSAHNTAETAYRVQWDILHHADVQLKDGTTRPGMFIGMHKCSAYGVQFSHQQAFYNAVAGLDAGTYYITLGASWGSNAVANKSYQFTLTQDVPAGGRLSGFEGMPDQKPANWKVKVWASATATEPTETVDVTEGSTGTFLGTMPYTNPGDSGLNCIQAVAYGSNRWATEALRQYLNSSGLNWYKSKGDYDIRPDQYAKHAWMDGFDDDFLNAIKPVRILTALNTVQDFSEAYEETYDTFFLPSLQNVNVNPQLANIEGPTFDWWKEALGSSSYVGTGSANVFDAFKIPAINANSPQHVRLRSAHRGSAHDAWSIHSSGYVNIYYNASNAHRFSPVCVIC